MAERQIERLVHLADDFFRLAQQTSRRFQIADAAPLEDGELAKRQSLVGPIAELALHVERLQVERPRFLDLARLEGQNGEIRERLTLEAPVPDFAVDPECLA